MILKTILTVLAVLLYFAFLFILLYLLGVFEYIENIKKYNSFVDEQDKFVIPKKFTEKIKFVRDMRLISMLVRFGAISQAYDSLKELTYDKKKI